MKKIVMILVVLSTAAAFAFYLARPAVPPAPQSEPEIASTPAPPEPHETGAVSIAEGAQPAKPAQPVAPNVPVAQASPTAAAPTQAALEAARLSQTVDVLVSSQLTYGQKQTAWNQLRAAGKLDAAIGDLEQRMAKDPRTAEYPAALGQAYLQKCTTIQDVREQGILGMQADKVFDAALAIDPNNWEARFTKAMAMSYWPAFLNKGEEVIQHFQTLVQQQEAQAPQPEFAETYSWLGEQYKRAGQAEQARATWQRGLALFPNNEGLKNKLAAPL